MSLPHGETSPLANETAQGVVRRVTVGMSVQGVGFALSTVLQIVLFPVLLSAWGEAVYGDWLVLFAAVSLFALADLGLQGYMTVGLRLSWARGDSAGFRRLLRSGLGTYVILTSIWIAAFLIFVLLIDVRNLLSINHLDAATEVFLLLGLPVLGLLPRGLVSSIYSARGEFGREMAHTFLCFIGTLIVQILVALAGGTPILVASTYCATSLLLGWGVLLLDVRRRHPDISLSISLPTQEELRTLAMKAPYYAVATGAVVLMQQMPVVVLGQLATPISVVVFTSMRTFSGLTRQVARQLSDGTGIEMARQHAQGDREGMLRLYTGTARLTGGAIGLLTGLSVVLGSPFFTLWTRGALGFDAMLAAAFFAVILLMAPAYAAGGLLRSTDHPRQFAAAFVMQAMLGVMLCPLFVTQLDALGAALAVGVAEALSLGLYSMWVAGRLMGVGMLALAIRTYKVTLLAFTLGAGVALVLGRLVPVHDLTSMLAFGVLWSVVLAAPALYLLLNATHRAWLWSSIRRVIRSGREYSSRPRNRDESALAP